MYAIDTVVIGAPAGATGDRLVVNEPGISAAETDAMHTIAASLDRGVTHR